MLNCDLRVGLAVDDLDQAAERIETWLDQKLDFASDLGRGGIFYQYEAKSIPADGLNYVRVSKNFVEGNGWVYETDERLKVLLEVFVRTPHVFDFGRAVTELEKSCPFDVVPLAYVIRQEARRPNEANAPLYTYSLEFDAHGQPIAPAPVLQCKATFALDDGDFDTTVAKVAGRLGGTLSRGRFAMHVQLHSRNFGLISLSRMGGQDDGETRLTAQWATPDLLQLGRLWMILDELVEGAFPVSHDIVGDLMADGNARQLHYETGP